MKREILIGEDIHTVTLVSNHTGRSLITDNTTAEMLSSKAMGNDSYQFNVGNLSTQATVVSKGEFVFAEVFDRHFAMKVLDPVEQAHAVSEKGDLSIKSPMPGVIVELHVVVGDEVEGGQSLVTIESMKLFTVLQSAGVGTVEALDFKVGDSFGKGVVLVKIKSSGMQDA